MKKIQISILLTSFALLFSCAPNLSEEEIPCIGLDAECEGFGWSYVRKTEDTYINLMGTDENALIHPDSIVVLNLSLDTMFHSIFRVDADNWYIVGISPWQELVCLNQCVLDSAFSRYYYVYAGNEDWDTVEVHFPAKTRFATVMEVYFNGVDPSIPEDKDVNQPRYSTYWFQK